MSKIRIDEDFDSSTNYSISEEYSEEDHVLFDIIIII